MNLITVKVFGEHADYPLANISEATFGAWARETKVLLRGHAELARTRQVLEDAIAPEAKEALWAMLPNLENIEKSYPNATWSTATTEARITARTAWQMAWLDRVTTACAPDAIVRVLERLATITSFDDCQAAARAFDSTSVTVRSSARLDPSGPSGCSLQAPDEHPRRYSYFSGSAAGLALAPAASLGLSQSSFAFGANAGHCSVAPSTRLGPPHSGFAQRDCLADTASGSLAESGAFRSAGPEGDPGGWNQAPSERL